MRGRLPVTVPNRPHGEEARQAYLEEATPLRPSGAVDLTRAFWSPRLGAE